MENKEFKYESNITCRRLSQHEIAHILLVNPLEDYLCINSDFISVLAQLTGEQLKELFSALSECYMDDIGTAAETVQDPMVKTLLNVIDSKGRQQGRYVIDFVGETL